MNITFVYLETFWTEHLGPEKDRYIDIRVGANLPLGIATVRAYISRDPDVRKSVKMSNLKFHDAIAEREAFEQIRKTKPDVAAFSIFLWNAPRTYSIIKLLKEEMPEVKIVVGGPEIPRKPELLRAFLGDLREIDVCVRGEGEETFKQLVNAWLAKKPIDKIDGIAFRDGADIVINQQRAGLDDIANLPSPYLENALEIFGNSDRGMLCVETSRGCPLVCSYCDYHAGRRTMRHFSIERLDAELTMLREKKFEGVIYITDPFLNVKKERCLEVFKILQKCPNRFLMELKAEHFDDELISELGKIPCATVALGVQTTGPEAIKNIERPFNIDRCARNISKIMHFKNLRLDLEFILGLPGDNYESFKSSLDWALQFVPMVNFTLFDLVMLPNAPIADHVEKYKIETDAEGLITSNYSFSEEDMMKASWLFVAYCYIRETPKLWADFGAFLQNPDRKGRPSAMLEKVAKQLLDTEFIPRERIVGQGGRRKNDDQRKRSRRWVEISPFTNIGVEAEAWW